MTCRGETIANCALIEETTSRQNKLEVERIKAASVELSGGSFKTEFIVPKMHCIACIGAIERGLSNVATVLNVRANLSMKIVSVVWTPERGSALEISKTLHALGFEHHLNDLPELQNQSGVESQRLLVALAVAGFAAANIMLLSVSVWSGAEGETARLFNLISGLIAVPAVLFAGQPFFSSAISSLASYRLNMDVPISLAVLLALGMSVFESVAGSNETYFDASITLLFFLLIGRYLDSMMRAKARGAVERLASLSAKSGVRVLPDESIAQIPVKDIRPGMLLRIFPGELFPVDGKITTGKTEIDRSHVSGEGEPVLVQRNSIVQAGSLNLFSSVDFEAISDAEDSFVGEMRRMICEAEKSRSKYMRIADRMAQFYAPAVHLLAFVAFVGWMIASGGDWHLSVYTAIAVLIITCPCALGLAVPVAHVIAANRLMQQGVMMRDGSALERLAEVEHIIFDKTGTLTYGIPAVTKVSGDLKTSASIIKAVSSASSHPLSRAIGLLLKDFKSAKIEDVHEFPGKGLAAIHDGRVVRLGKPHWVEEISGSTQEDYIEYSTAFAVEGGEMVYIDMQDALREDAAKVVSILKAFGFSSEIVSGDNAAKVEAVAHSIGIDTFAGNQSPRQKINRVHALQEDQVKTLMVGDGINDAPALAAGHVSFVPASASDIGRHSADFVFIRHQLSALPFSIKLSHLTAKIVKQNFGLAFTYNCVAVPLAMAGFITPLLAAVFMSASSMFVVANSFRLNFAKLDQEATKQLQRKVYSQNKPEVVGV